MSFKVIRRIITTFTASTARTAPKICLMLGVTLPNKMTMSAANDVNHISKDITCTAVFDSGAGSNTRDLFRDRGRGLTITVSVQRSKEDADGDDGNRYGK